jgi:hypothetical protein
MCHFKKIKTVGDFLNHMKIYDGEWTAIEVVNGFVLDYTFESSPFIIRDMTLISPTGSRSRISMKVAYH